MARSRRTATGNGLDAWPGYVDALSTLLMVFVFVLLVFALSQAFLTATLSGRNEMLAKVGQELSALAKAFDLEKSKANDLQLSVSRLSRDLASANTDRDSLNKTVAADKELIQAKLADIARLDRETKALAALRDELTAKVKSAAAETLTERERGAALQLRLNEQQQIGDSARAQLALLNRQAEELNAQISSIREVLGITQQQVKDRDVEIRDLTQKLNTALAEKVEELRQYRSEFFGRMRTVLADKPGIQVVGDRFVFQSEVLFAVGKAELTQAGVQQMTDLAQTVRELALAIPPDVKWILRVDGHTDPQPVRGGNFMSNWELSSARAINVVRLLIQLGVPPQHLAATGFGEFQPIVPGDTEDDYAKDRRIEIRLTDR